jgi:exodeoxyribonuclease VII large subunit
VAAHGRATARAAQALERRAGAAQGPEAARRRAALDGLAAALGAHDPTRTLARGFAMVDDGAGTLVTSAAAARAQGAVRLVFADGDVGAQITQEGQ